MPRLGYSYVPEEGFLSLLQTLESKEWGAIDVSAFLATGTALSPLQATQQQGWKLRLWEKIQSLSQQMSRTESKTALAVDSEWDQLQRQLDGETYVHVTRKDEEKRAAALRLRDRLLLGGGTGQTRLSLEKEIDWGRQQIQLAKEEPFASDIVRLSLGDLFAEIATKTEELAATIGHGESEARQFRSLRIRGALVACQQSADAVTDEILYYSEHPNCTEEEKSNLQRLLAPLVRMAERYLPLPEKPAPADVGTTPTPES